MAAGIDEQGAAQGDRREDRRGHGEAERYLGSAQVTTDGNTEIYRFDVAGGGGALPRDTMIMTTNPAGIRDLGCPLAGSVGPLHEVDGAGGHL